MSPMVFCLSRVILSCRESPSLYSYTSSVVATVKPAGAVTAMVKLWFALWLPVMGETT